MYQKLGFSLSYYDVNKLNVLYDGKKNKKDYRCYGIMTKKDFFDKINNKEDNTEKHDRVINSNSGYVYNLFLLFGSIMFLCYLCVQGAIYLVKENGGMFMTLDSVLVILRAIIDISLVWMVIYFILKNIKNNVKMVLLFKGVFVV